MTLKTDWIYITGSTGFVGKRLKAKLQDQGYRNILESKIDLTNPLLVDEFFRTNKPDVVIHLAAKVGGIEANRKDNLGFLLSNLKMSLNVFEAALKYKSKKVINLGSSCMYPKDHPVQPMTEEMLMDGKLEGTNIGYALAKIVAQKIGELANKQTSTHFVTLSPCNLYGPGDHIGSENSHALAAMIYKVTKAYTEGLEEIEVWGTGDQRREWLYVDDLVDCLCWSLDIPKTDTFLNVGTGKDISMNELATLVIEKFKATIDPSFSLKIKNDPSKPNGMLRKLTDSSKINSMGWKSKTDLEEGIQKTLESYLDSQFEKAGLIRGNYE